MPAPGLRVCFFGDSITNGVGDETTMGWVGRVVASARTDGWDLTGHNLGIRGETGSQVHARWRAEAEPRLQRADGYGVVVGFGVNDAIQGVPEAETLGVLARFGDEAAEAGWPLLVVGPTLVDDDRYNERLSALSTAMGAHCGSRGIPFVELAAHLQDSEWRSEVATQDGAHPSARGYERLSRLIHPAFAAWLPSLPQTGIGSPMRISVPSGR